MTAIQESHTNNSTVPCSERSVDLDFPRLREIESAISDMAQTLGSFEKRPETFTREAYLIWRGQRRITYRNLAGIIRQYRIIARNSRDYSDFDRSTAQMRHHRGRSAARLMMKHLAEAKELCSKTVSSSTA